MTIAADDLSAPERRLWEAFRTGEWVDLRTGDDEADDPLGGADWGTEGQVRAEVIAALLAGAMPVEPGSVGVLALQGARIDDGTEECPGGRSRLITA
jgi:hypothetical protein